MVSPQTTTGNGRNHFGVNHFALWFVLHIPILAPLALGDSLKADYSYGAHVIDPEAIAIQMLALMPSSVEPGDPPIDLSEVVSRMRCLDRQRLFLAVDEWLEANESWVEGAKLEFLIEDGGNLSWDEELLINGSPPHEKQINAIEELVALLEDNLVPENKTLIEKLGFLFTSEIYLPMGPREALCGVAADYNVVDDPANWLMRHRTTRQAAQLSTATDSAGHLHSRPRI